MTKPVKITLWSITGILSACLIAITVIVSFVFSKDKLTPIVRQQIPNYVNCQTDLDNVELTFFSTFPHFAIQLNNVVLINPKEGAKSDTLAYINELQAVVDAMAYLKENAVHIKEFRLNDGLANLYIASDSTTNFDVLVPTEEEGDSSALGEIELRNVKFQNINFSMVNDFNHQQIYITGLDANLNGDLSDLSKDIQIEVDSYASGFQYADTLSSFHMSELKVPSCNIEIIDSLNMKVYLSTSFQNMGFSLLGNEPMELNTGALHLKDLTLCMAGKDLTAGVEIVLDTLSMQLGGKDPLALQLSDASFLLPDAKSQDQLQAFFDARVASATLQSKTQGQLLNHLPLSMSGYVSAKPDLTLIQLSDAKLRAKDEELAFNVSMENIDSLTTQVSADLSLASTTFARLLSLVPQSFKKALNGQLISGSLDELTASAKVTMMADKPLEIDAFEVNTIINDLKYNQTDTMLATAQKVAFSTRYPVENSKLSMLKNEQQQKRQKATNNKRRSKKVFDSSFMQANFVGNNFHFEMHDSSNVVADLPRANFNCTLSDEILQDAQSLPFIAADFSFNKLSAAVDTVSLKAHDMSGSFTMADGMRGMKKYYEAFFESIDADIQMGSSTSIVTGPLIIEASSIYDHEQKDLLLRYNPLLNITLEKGNVQMAGIPYPFEIPAIDFDFNLGKFLIRDSQLRYGGSDFKLTGEIKNLREYLKKESDLLADLKLHSAQTDVYQLMDLVELMAAPTDSVAGPSDTEAYINATLQEHQSAEVSMSESNGGDPFIVPQAVDLTLSTDITKTIVGENEFHNLGGKLYIKDGNLVLEEMGFSSKAARMQLTALYRTPQKNNLFVGANFHLLDIDVADLIKMVPEIDTIVPMLRSFEGKAEFHLAAETNLFGNYDVKMSTLKATGAIEGKDLVLLDGETFSTMSKYLMFNKKTRNKIDTLSVEMAVNRKRMTVYPMLIGMDKYQAVISGTHDLTGVMPFNYHVSITDCPVVGGLVGLDLEGDMQKPEAISYKLVGCKYASLYKPEKRKITQEQTLELKSLISDALKRTVREQ